MMTMIMEARTALGEVTILLKILKSGPCFEYGHMLWDKIIGPGNHIHC